MPAVRFPGGGHSATRRTTPVVTPVPAPVNQPANVNKSILDQFISVFENSTLTLAYDFISNLNDGRGYTAGRAGFTSRDGDMLVVVQRYLALKPSSSFSQLLPTLQSVAASGSSSVSGLSSLPSIWMSSAQDPVFRSAQDAVSDEQYYLPALQVAKQYQITTPIGILSLYDAAIEHGIDGADGVTDMISRLKSRNSYATEIQWLAAFLAVRRATLLNPKDHTTQAVWADSVGRVDAIKKLLDEGNLDLTPPMAISPFGDEFIIGATSK